MSLRDQMLGPSLLEVLQMDELEISVSATPKTGKTVRASEIVDLRVSITNHLGKSSSVEQVRQLDYHSDCVRTRCETSCPTRIPPFFIPRHILGIGRFYTPITTTTSTYYTFA